MALLAASTLRICRRREIDHHRVAVRQGRGAAAQAGVAALGHHGHAAAAQACTTAATCAVSAGSTTASAVPV
jgi:hypothetical protein